MGSPDLQDVDVAHPRMRSPHTGPRADSSANEVHRHEGGRRRRRDSGQEEDSALRCEPGHRRRDLRRWHTLGGRAARVGVQPPVVEVAQTSAHMQRRAIGIQRPGHVHQVRAQRGVRANDVCDHRVRARPQRVVPPSCRRTARAGRPPGRSRRALPRLGHRTRPRNGAKQTREATSRSPRREPA